MRKLAITHYFINAMTSISNQKKISTFFQPLSQKRENVTVPDDNEKDRDSRRRASPGSSRSSSPSQALVVIPRAPLKKPKLATSADGQENIPKTPPKSPVASTSSAYLETSPSQPESATTSPKPDEKVAASPLSPEQKQRMDASKLEAEMKLMTKKTHGVVVNVGPTWYKALKPEFEKPYFLKLAELVSQERQKSKVFPPAGQVFTWTTTCDIRQINTVIIGQDPYHDVGQAHGLCFSVQKGIKPPPSLVNMYKELEKDIEGFKHPGHGDLTGWAEQGVLLLNACLTVRAHNANSHAGKGWEKLTDATITWINKNLSGVVFLLWGAYAQKKCAFIDKKKHHILKAVHPSPLSAHRGFFGCKHFSQCNALLKKQGKKPIDWCHLPQQN